MYSTIRGNRFSLFFIIHFLLGSILLQLILSILPEPLATDTLLPVALSQLVLVLLPIFYYILFTKLPIKKTFRLYKTRPLNIFLSILLAFFSLPIVMLINLISQFFVQQALADTLSTIAEEPYWLALIVIALFPALFEELVTRGIFLSHFRHRKVLTASIMCGLFFGIIHLNFNQFLYAFFLGFIFALVLHITGSIFCTMTMHFIINGFNLSLTYIASLPIVQQLSEATESAMDNVSHTEALVAALPAVILLLIVSLPLFGVILFIMISANDKGALLKANAPSKDFFPQEQSFTNDLAEAQLDVSVESDESLQDMSLIPTPVSPRLITMPFALTTLLFIGFSILNEIA